MSAPNYYIGLMSGTSMDGIDAALVDFNNDNFKIIATYYHPLSDLLKKDLINLISTKDISLNDYGHLDAKLGEQFAEACLKLLATAQLDTKQIKAIGSHGQTIYHRPDGEFPFSLQLADPNIICARTGITTIADFRRRDIAYGGQGAPLTPAFHSYYFRSTIKNRLVLNIGGIANLTILPAKLNQTINGFDLGPGNTLMDAWCRQQLDKPFDQNGQWAASGNVHQPLLDLLLADPYFKQTPPKSTGFEYFNLTWLNGYLKQLSTPLDPADVQATLLMLTINSITQTLQQHHLTDYDIVLCGGGIHNQALINQLQVSLPQTNIASTESLGVAPDWLEAIAFAWLAKQTLDNQPSNLPAVTGATQTTILGAVYYP